MQTNVLLFILYSIIAAAVLYVAPDKLKRVCLLIFNIVFYYLCDAKCLFFISGGILWSFYVCRKLETEKKKFLLVLGIVPVIFLLCFFKYYHFFVPDNSDVLQIIMPLGFSYYSFKIISCIVDSYTGRFSFQMDLLDYANYVGFFAQIICGPISRAEELLVQVRKLKNTSYRMINNGLYLILSGLFKKIVIADRLTSYVNTVFANQNRYPALALWMAAFLYTVQIYCDFAGYSEIVIGICNLLGIECKPNFRYPYFSYSIKEFWNRWHISLSSWLKDYIYIPLGGNRKGKIRKSINVLITFLVSGIWHGNALSFIFWGLYHGIFNLIPVKKSKNKYCYIGQILGCFMIVMFGWIFFKSDTVTEACGFIYRMIFENAFSVKIVIDSVMPFTGDYSCLAHFITILLLVLILIIFEYGEFRETHHKKKEVRMVVYLICIIFFGVMGSNNFLYANF